MLRWYDALLVAVNGLNRYVSAGHQMSVPSYSADMCLSEEIEAWPDGQDLLHYLQTVRTLPYSAE